MTDNDNVTRLSLPERVEGDNRMTADRFRELNSEYDECEEEIQDVRAKQKLLKDELKAAGFRVQAFTHWRWRQKQADIAAFDEMIGELEELSEQPELPL